MVQVLRGLGEGDISGQSLAKKTSRDALLPGAPPTEQAE
jgi:hypothetical protein